MSHQRSKDPKKAIITNELLPNGETKKPLLLYSALYEYTAESFVDKMNEIPEDENIEIWMNCPGGRVFAGWSVIGPLQKRTGNINLSIFGHASSMASFIPLYCNHVEMLEVAKIILHRAEGYVDTPEDQEYLDTINKDLRKQMEARLNIEVFEKVTNHTIDDLFDPNQRIEIVLNAQQAKKLGYIDAIKKLTPQEIKAQNEHFVAYADFSQRSEGPDPQRSEENNDPESQSIIIDEPKKEFIMTKEELKAQNPAVYAQVYEEGKTEGIKLGTDAEFDRVSAHLTFVEIDPKATKEAIEGKKAISQKFMADMTVKMASVKHLETAITDAPGDLKLDNKEPAEEKEVTAEVKAYEANMRKAAGLKEKKVEATVME